MIKNTNTLLLYIFMILLLYCFMYIFIYNDKELVFDSTLDKFMDLTEEEQQAYIDNLRQIKNKFNDGIINDNYVTKIKTDVNNFKLKQQDQTTLDNISSIYLKDYIENINRKNAIVYNQYIKLYSQSK